RGFARRVGFGQQEGGGEAGRQSGSRQAPESPVRAGPAADDAPVDRTGHRPDGDEHLKGAHRPSQLFAAEKVPYDGGGDHGTGGDPTACKARKKMSHQTEGEMAAPAEAPA